MSAKDDIERLEQKIDILYNVVWYLMNATKQYDMAEYFSYNIMNHVDVEQLDSEFLDILKTKG